MSPAAKKRRISEDVMDPEADEITDEEYVELTKELKEIYSNPKKKSRQKRAREVMLKTRARRWRWIVQQKPQIGDVLREFPQLMSEATVSTFIVSESKC